MLSIRKNIPVNKLIVVDRFSTDGTINVIRKFFPDAEIIQENYGLAKARQRGIACAETEYCAFVDSDILLAPNWAETMFAIIKKYDNIGGAHGKDLYLNPHLNKYQKWERKYYYFRDTSASSDVKIVNLRSLQRHKVRGLTHNTLVLYDAVKEWSPPSMLNTGEDHHLMVHVLKKGYVWCAVNRPTAIHYAFKDLKEVIRRGVTEGYSTRFLNEYKIIESDLSWSPTSLMQWTKLFGLVLLKSLLAAFVMKDPLIVVHNQAFYSSCVKGYLECFAKVRNDYGAALLNDR